MPGTIRVSFAGTHAEAVEWCRDLLGMLGGGPPARKQDPMAPLHILEAAYNGVCLAAENGKTEAYKAKDVSVMDLMAGTFTIRTRDGKVFTIRIEGDF